MTFDFGTSDDFAKAVHITFAGVKKADGSDLSSAEVDEIVSFLRGANSNLEAQAHAWLANNRTP